MTGSKFDEELKSHLETWGPNCGASLAVYTGHLQKLLLSAQNIAYSAGFAAGTAAERERAAKIALNFTPQRGIRLMPLIMAIAAEIRSGENAG